MKHKNTVWIIGIAFAVIGLVSVGAQDSDVSKLLRRIEELEQKVKALEAKGTNSTVEALDQKVRILERKKELADEAAAEKAKTTATVTISDNGLVARSADTNFSIALHGVLQVDNRTFFDDGDIRGNDGFLLRRARPILQGTLYRDFDFLFVPDFGGSSAQIFDAYLNYRYQPWLQVRAGKFKTPVGLEQLQADRDTFFNERSLVTALVPNRDIGFQLWGDIGNGAVSYAAGVFNGVGDARNSSNADFEDHRDVAGRLFTQPFKNTSLSGLQGLGFGVAGSYGDVSPSVNGLPNTTGGTLPGYATDGQQQFFAYNPTNGAVLADGLHWRLSPQASYFYGPFGFLGEYIISNQRVSRTAAPLVSDELDHRAWQVSGSCLLTGESASYGTVSPKRPFNLSQGDWGALQLVGRYARLDIDDDAFPLYSNPLTSASEARAWSVGLNWYLNKNVLLKLSYSRTTFDGGGGSGAVAPATVTRQPEQVFFTRLQLAF